ncbi:MAG: class I SAM-dependent methyltransferase [Vulcanimicrobiota bacterium]
MKTDQKILDNASQSYYYSDKMSTDNRLRRFLIRRCLKHVHGPRILELGFMDGQWTREFLSHGFSVDIVEGAAKQFETAEKIYAPNPSVRVFHSLFEDYEPDGAYDTILAGGMIKHLPEPGLLLGKMKEWLNESGVLVATTPNASSLHRRVGTFMGILESPEDLTDSDLAVANLRVYNRYTFRKELIKAEWKIIELSGCGLKPVSTEQMTDWSDELLEALDRVSEELIDYSWYIYAICVK